MPNIFETLGLPARPILLAPLAGVSDHPFRRVCAASGADLTYVEMISATALVHDSRRTMDMLTRHPSETKLGVQITARSASEMGEAVARLDSMPFDTIDINMGCPVRKVVSAGCGSAILKDPERVYQTTLAACRATSKPVTVKIRLGWDHEQLTYKEVGLAAQSAGARWVTLHGRTRNDTYGEPVDLEKIAELKQLLDIPVLANGNLFSQDDANMTLERTNCDGLMVSRGALGNPWVFDEIKGLQQQVTLDQWISLIRKHLQWQNEAYGDAPIGAVCMRKHVLWYVKGWPNARKIRDKIGHMTTLEGVQQILEEYAEELYRTGVTIRTPVHFAEEAGSRFLWDPKFEMDRQLDRGIGDDRIESTSEV